jgi:hypothetical protein
MQRMIASQGRKNQNSRGLNQLAVDICMNTQRTKKEKMGEREEKKCSRENSVNIKTIFKWNPHKRN